MASRRFITCLSAGLFLSLLAAGCQTATKTLNPPKRIGISTPTPSKPLSSLTWPTGIRPGNSPADIDLMTRAFDQYVFETEWNGPAPWIVKGGGAYPYWLVEDFRSAEVRASIKEISVQLEEATGQIISEASAEPEGRIRIIVSVGKTGSRKHCHFSTKRYGDGTLSRAVIYIGPDYPDMRHCLVEELSQILGSSNDISLIEDSLWRPKEVETARGLTWSDAVILRALYDERLKPGMSRAAALPVVRIIISELLEELNR